MVVTLGQQYNVGEKSTVILYTVNRHAETPDKKKKQNRNDVVVHNKHGIVMIYCFIGCTDKASTWYLNGFPDGSDIGSTV